MTIVQMQFRLFGSLAMLLTSGCINLDFARSPRFWPKPVAATSLQQFQGVYRNHSLDDKTGEVTEYGYPLFAYLIGGRYARGERGWDGERVEIHVTSDENRLMVDLFDLNGHEVDSATLQRNKVFVFSGEKLILQGPFAGWGELGSNLAPGVKHTRYRLRLSSSGGLRGDISEKKAGLFFGFIPEAGTTKHMMFWPKVAE